MQDRDAIRIRMYGNVIQVCNTHKSDWATSPVITKIVNSLTASFTRMNENNNFCRAMHQALRKLSKRKE